MIHLPIKKTFFDKIITGEKKFEYREDKLFFRKMFDAIDVDYIIFHYYRKEKIKVKVLSIRKVKTPKKCKLIKTEKCYRIKLDHVTQI